MSAQALDAETARAMSTDELLRTAEPRGGQPVVEPTKVSQTIVADDPKRQGNCLSACVATAVGLSLDEVPHFIEFGIRINGEDDTVSWWSMLLGFMAARGLWPLELDDPSDADPGEITFVMGMSPRGVCHQVIYRDGSLWHDPHPSGDGVIDVREVIVWRPARHDHAPTLDGATA